MALPGAGFNYATGAFSSSLAAADINGDGNTDLIIANEASNSLSVMIGKGDGTFDAPVVILGMPSGPQSLAVADYNSDGMASGDPAFHSDGASAHLGSLSPPGSAHRSGSRPWGLFPVKTAWYAVSQIRSRSFCHLSTAPSLSLHSLRAATEGVVEYLIELPNRTLPQQADSVLERGVLGLIVVLRVQILDLGLSQVQLRLRQFDDRGQTQVVAARRPSRAPSGCSPPCLSVAAVRVSVGAASMRVTRIPTCPGSSAVRAYTARAQHSATTRRFGKPF